MQRPTPGERSDFPLARLKPCDSMFSLALKYMELASLRSLDSALKFRSILVWVLNRLTVTVGSLRDHGLLVEINSLAGEEDARFELAASIRVRYLAPELVFQEEQLEFGEVWQGGSNSESIMVANSGEGDGRIMRIEPAEEFAGQISWDVELPYTINPDEEAEITFRWQPEENGELETEIEIFHNDPVLDNPLVVSARCISLLRIEDGRSLKTREFSLHQNFPNPFNSTTTIRYSLPYPSYVSLQVYNLSGQLINTLFEGYRQAGFHSAKLTANNLPTGLYFVRLNASDKVFMQKVMLIR